MAATKKQAKSSFLAASDQDYNLWALFRQTRDAMIKARERELAEHGISSIQAAVLFTIQDIGAVATPAEISRRLVREPHSISGLLSRMEKQGLIKRTKDLPKRNMVRITLTPKGKALYEFSTQRATMHEVFSVVDDAERKVLWDYLQRLRDKALKLAGIGYEMPFPPPYTELED